MKNSIRKRRYKSKSSKKQEVFLYNVASMGVIVEVLVGAILGCALCFGFLVSFFVLGGSLIFSIGILFLILIAGAIIALFLKYTFISVLIRIRELEILDRFFKQF